MTYLDKDQVLAALEEELKAAKVLPLHPMDIEGQEAHEEGIARVEWAIEFVADLPAIPLDADTELSDIMEYLCEHFDASMDEHEVSRMSAMIREYASNVAKSRGALPVLETRIVNAIGGNEVNTSAYNTVEPVKRETEQ